MRVLKIIGLLTLFGIHSSFGQHAHFSISSDTVCLEENIELINSSINAATYKWDFCVNDLDSLQGLSRQTKIEGASFTSSNTIAYDSGQWYGYVLSYLNNKLFQLSYGSSLDNIPSVLPVSNIDTILNAPYNLKLYQEEATWYGLLVNSGNNKLLRLTFGNGLGKSLTNIEDLGDFGSLNVPYGVNIVKDNGNVIAIVANSAGDNLTLINFGNSIANAPGTNYIIIGTGSGIDLPNRLSMINVSDRWYGLLGSRNNNRIYRIDFKEHLYDTDVSFTSVASLSEPTGVEIAYEAGKYKAIATSRLNGFYQLVFGDNITNTPEVTYKGKGGISDEFRSLSVVRESPVKYGFVTSRYGELLSQVLFEDNCEIESSTEFEPIASYTTAGLKWISLTAQDEYGRRNEYADTIQVLNQVAPEINFTIGTNRCVTEQISFSGTSGQNIILWNWNFGDGQTGSGQNVSHLYSAAGVYSVTLEIIGENGCGNFFEKEVVVYSEPQAAYTVSEALVCTNAAVGFTNGTAVAQGAPVSYSWDFGDGTTSAEESPQHTYSNAGTYAVVLSATIPGCTTTSTQSIEVKAGPQTLFAASPVCEGETVVFDNQTTGEEITGYSWDLGDGTFSTLENPEHIYDAPGEYTVVLKSANALGCETSYTQAVRVYSLPQPDFSHSPACEGNTVQFTDATTDTDGNLIAWNWEFEMPDGTTVTSNEQHPEVTYARAGNYEVRLTATTTWSCNQTLQKTIVVDPMPEVEIGFDGACAGESATISDITHTGGFAVQSWYWLVGDDLFTDSTFTYHFEEEGTYEVFLQLNLENGCSVQGTRQLIIEPLPEVDFAISGACVGQTASFEALTPSTEYVWTIEGRRIVSDGPVLHHAFASEGTYAVQLTVFDERGCSNSLGKELVVGQPPVAAFSADRLRGVPPFTVNFTNLSEGSVAWHWFFGDAQQSSSSLENPSFIFTEIGDYSVQLISYNEAGCADTVSQVVSVLAPKYDVALTNLHKISQDNQMQLVLDLENKGTIQVYNMEIEISINNEYILNELFTDTLEIGEQRNYPLSVVLNEQGGRKLEFVCIRLKPRLSLVSEELSVLNNEKCLNFDQTFIMQAPHPNPGSSEVTLSFVLPESGGSVVLELYTAQGGLVQKGELKDMKPGFNQHPLDISGLGKGMYYVRCRYGAEQRSYRILKN